MTSDDEKDAIIGKAVREHAEACQQAAALNAALAELGKEFELLAQQLTTDPSKLAAIGQGLDGRFSGAYYAAKPDKLNIAKALEMAGELRDTLTKQWALERQLNQLGVPPRQ